MKKIMQHSGDVFIKKYFTQREIDTAPPEVDTCRYFAARFAAKESIFKAFGLGVSVYPGTDIELNGCGKPVVKLYGEFSQYAKQIGVNNILVNISHDGDYAVAVSIIER